MSDVLELPKRVRDVIAACQQGQVLCRYRMPKGEHDFTYGLHPSLTPIGPKTGDEAIACGKLIASDDGLFPGMSQTWRAA